MAVAEVKAKEDGSDLICIISRPYKGETFNECRIADGLSPIDIPEWDEPRT